MIATRAIRADDEGDSFNESERRRAHMRILGIHRLERPRPSPPRRAPCSRAPRAAGRSAAPSPKRLEAGLAALLPSDLAEIARLLLREENAHAVLVGRNGI